LLNFFENGLKESSSFLLNDKQSYGQHKQLKRFVFIGAEVTGVAIVKRVNCSLGFIGIGEKIGKRELASMKIRRRK
jgi:hypothetical protein